VFSPNLLVKVKVFLRFPELQRLLPAAFHLKQQFPVLKAWFLNFLDLTYTKVLGSATKTVQKKLFDFYCAFKFLRLVVQYNTQQLPLMVTRHFIF